MGFDRFISTERDPLHSRIAIVVVLASALLTLSMKILAERAAVQAKSFDEAYTYADSRYPVIFAGSAIRWPMEVATIDVFEPLFGRERDLVNPTLPRIEEGRILRFHEPGEYYLHLNKRHHLKILVLDPHEPISKGVLRTFDFLVANLLVSNGEDSLWYDHNERYIQRWFHSNRPGLLLCGPTDKMFRMLVEERFRVPTRLVTLPGVARRNGELVTSTHNVSEVYLPDRGKFVMFDLNHALVARWMSATDWAHTMHAVVGDRAQLADQEWEALDLDLVRTAPEAFRPVREDVLNGQEDLIRFSRDLVSDVPVRQSWKHTATWYYGGIAYRGLPYHGTGFLPEDYNFGTLHADPEMLEATVELIKSYGPGASVGVFPLGQLEQMLEDGFRAQIEARAWRERVPPTVVRAGARLRAA